MCIRDRFSTFKCAHERSEDELEPEHLDYVEAYLQNGTGDGAIVYERWVRRNGEHLLDLIIPVQEPRHEKDSGDDVTTEENRIDQEERKPFRHLMLEHPPSVVHSKCGPFAK